MGVPAVTDLSGQEQVLQDSIATGGDQFEGLFPVEDAVLVKLGDGIDAGDIAAGIIEAVSAHLVVGIEAVLTVATMVGKPGTL